MASTSFEDYLQMIKFFPAVIKESLEQYPCASAG